MNQKFKKGDKVKVVEYGHLGWYSSIETLNEFKNLNKKLNKDFLDMLMWGKETVGNVRSETPQEDYSHLILPQFKGEVVIDESPELIGKEGIIEGSYADLFGNGKELEERQYKTYSIKGIPSKSAWYDEA